MIYVSLLILLLWSTLAHAVTFYTSTTGSDVLHTCTQAQNESTAKRTIDGVDGGISCLNAGDELVIKGGTYAEEINAANIPSGTSWATATTIRGADGETVIIQPDSAATQPAIGYFGPARQYHKWLNLTLDLSLAPRDCQFCKGVQTSDDDADFIHMEGLTIKNTPATAFGILTNCDGWRILYNLIEGVDGSQSGGTQGAHGFYFRGSDAEIRGNIIRNFSPNNDSGNCIQFFLSGSTFPACEMDNNQFVDNWCDGYPDYAVFLDTETCNHVITGNIFSNAGEHGGPAGSPRAVRYLGGGGGQVHFIHSNTFFDIPNDACEGCPSDRLVNNIFHDVPNSATFGTFAITDPTDPLFTNEAAGDFTLQSGSPAINAGTATPSHASRNCNGNCDIGAHETFQLIVGPTTEIGTVNDTTLVMAFENAYEPFVAPGGCTGFSVGGMACTPSCLSVTPQSGNTIHEVLSCPAVGGETITTTYTGTHVRVVSHGPLILGQPLHAFTAESVVNNSGSGPVTGALQIEGITMEGFTINP